MIGILPLSGGLGNNHCSPGIPLPADDRCILKFENPVTMFFAGYNGNSGTALVGYLALVSDKPSAKSNH